MGGSSQGNTEGFDQDSKAKIHRTCPKHPDFHQMLAVPPPLISHIAPSAQPG